MSNKYSINNNNDTSKEARATKAGKASLWPPVGPDGSVMETGHGPMHDGVLKFKRSRIMCFRLADT